MGLQLPRSIALGFLLSMAGGLFAQTSIDTLRAVWRDRSEPDSVRYNALRTIIKHRRYAAPPDSLLELAEQLLAFARERGGALQQANALNLCGSLHNNLNQWELAESAFKESHRLYESINDTTGMTSVLNNLGNTASYRGDQVASIEYHSQCLRLSEARKDSSVMARVLGNIGVTHFELKDYDVALDHFHRRIAVAEAIGDEQCVLEAWLCIAITKDRQGAKEEARQGFERSLTLAKRINDVTSICVAHGNLGKLEVLAGNHDRGRAHLDSALRMAQADADPMAMASALTDMARSYSMEGDHLRALAIAEKAMTSARESGTREVMRDAAEVLFIINKALGRTGAALVMHELFIATRDSMLAEEDLHAVMFHRFQYEFDKKEAVQQAKREQERALTEAELALNKARQRNILIGSALLVALVVALLLLYRNSKRNTALLAEKNTAILDAQAKLLESERAREASEVRTRIARDVHDQLGSDLTKLVLLSTEAKEVAQTNTTGMQDIANDIERIAGEANRSLGDIVWSIDPHHDSLAGLTERVRAHCARMLKWSKVEHTIDCAHEGPDRSLDPATKRDIYLMLREALNNAIKYAKAQHIHVRFHSSATQVEFEVKDDGVGMVEGNTKGHGLKNMQQRAERIGGVLLTETAEGRGTRIAFHSALVTA